MQIRKTIFKFCTSKNQPKRAIYNIEQQHENDIKPENLDRFIYPNDQHVEKRWALYKIISCPKNFITQSKFFINMVSSMQPKQLSSNSELFVPPKIHENSVFIYHSRNKANAFRLFRSGEYLVAAFLILIAPQPLYSLPFMAWWYILWGNSYIYEPSRRMVVRMDLLPHLEMISIQKVGPFGQVYNKLIKISDLEKLSYEECSKKENYFWMMQKNSLDRDLIFRDKSTGEYLLFDNEGIWDQEGFSHPLIY